MCPSVIFVFDLLRENYLHRSQAIPKRPGLFAAQYGYTLPPTLRSIAAAAAYIQRRTLLHLKKKEVMRLPGILATCAGQIHWTDKHSNQ